VVCGDGNKGPGEQCDDANLTNGDGCNDTCHIEVQAEIEPNDTALDADTNGPFPFNKLWGGAINPGTDIDFFAIQIPTTSDLKIETFDAFGPVTCAAINTIVELRAPDGVTILATDDNDGVNNCSLIDPANVTDFGARHLAPGTYYVRVRSSANALIAAYTVQLTLTAVCGNNVVEGFEECDGAAGAPCDANCNRVPVCGDTFIDSPENCDDGNANAGDGCSDLCQVEGVIAELEPNGTIAEADATGIVLGDDSLLAGSISPVGDKDTFKVTVANATAIRFETFETPTFDCPNLTTTLRLLDAAGVQLKTDSTTGIKSCSALVVYLAAGTYYIQVEETGNNAAIPTYFLQVEFEDPLGNEVEPNETIATATVMAGDDVYIFGDHQLGTDLDYYAITVPQGKAVRAEIIEGDLVETCESNGIDAEITLFSAAAVLLNNDDDSGRGFCSLIDGTGGTPLDPTAGNLPAGTYYLEVRKSDLASAAGAIFNYRLVVTVR
jgi:cysteine-rich repeat protein